MFSRTLAVSLAAAATLSGTTALAQDANDRSTHFDGPYLSVAVGATMQPSDRGDTLTFDRNNDGTYGDTVTTATGANAFAPGFCNGYFTSATNGDCTDDKNRPDYAVRIGVDKRMGNFVAGVLVEGEINKSRDATSAFSSTPAAYRIARGMDYGFALRARAGITPGGGALFYATGGVGYARLKHIFTTTNTVNQFTPQRDKTWRWGYQAGGGTEIMVAPHVSLGIEYLYNHYRDNKYFVAVTQGTAAATNPFILAGGQTNIASGNSNFNFHTARATMTFRF